MAFNFKYFRLRIITEVVEDEFSVIFQRLIYVRMHVFENVIAFFAVMTIPIFNGR